MNTLQLKKNFHSLIDNLQNEHLLLSFYSMMKDRMHTEDGQLISKLSEQEQEELFLSLDESEQIDCLIAHDEIIKKHQKWL